MERLTKTYEDGTHAAADDLLCGENSWEYKNRLLERLGAYEDAGLNPEDVATAKALAIQYLKQTIAENDAYKQLGREEGIDVTCICEANKVLERALLKLVAGYRVN